MESKQPTTVYTQPFLPPSGQDYTQDYSYNNYSAHPPHATQSATKPGSSWKNRLSQTPKWLLSLRLFLTLTILIFILNTCLLIWAVASPASRSDNGLTVLYTGSCTTVRRSNIVIHLFINILSSALLAGSNYCMQCLSAPTRNEVEDQHEKGRALDVSVQSWGNIWGGGVRGGRRVAWWMLAITSGALHLCYNSVVLPNLPAQTYGVIQFNSTTLASLTEGNYTHQRYNSFEVTTADLYNRLTTTPGALTELTPQECISAYSQPFQSTHGTVFLIPTAEDGDTVRKVEFTYPPISRSGTCAAELSTQWVYDQFRAQFGGDGCFSQDASVWVPRLLANTSEWRPLGAGVEKCLSQPMQTECKLNFSPHLAGIVVGFNLIKVFVIWWSLRALKKSAPLLTVGDAVSSFLGQRDAHTRGMGLVGMKEVKASKASHWEDLRGPRPFTGGRKRWSTGVKRSSLITCIASLTFSIIVLLALFLYSYFSISGTRSLSALLSLPFGTLSAQTLIQSGTPSIGLASIFANVLLANSPQLIISLVYFAYNGALTGMCSAAEWDSFSVQRKGLRVSGLKRGAQRSTYFLQLPFRFALPLLAVSILLHWLASQSLFVVSVELQNLYGVHAPGLGGNCFHWGSRSLADGTRIKPEYCGEDFVACAYSSLGILLAFVVACLMLLGLVGIGFTSLKGGMPVMGGCSVAIAAACQGPERSPGTNRWQADQDGACEGEMEVQWGVMPEVITEAGVEHCGFSTGRVERPIVGRFYA